MSILSSVTPGGHTHAMGPQITLPKLEMKRFGGDTTKSGVHFGTHIRSLRRLYDTVEVPEQGLKALSVPFKSLGSLPSFVLMNKICQDLY